MWNKVRAMLSGSPVGRRPRAGALVAPPPALAPIEARETTDAGVPPATVAESATARAREQLTLSVAAVGSALGRADVAADAHSALRLLAQGPPESLRQIPAAARELLRALEDPDLSRVRLGTLIDGDPVVAQAVLRTANSAVFNAGQGTVASLPYAIDRLGLNITRAVIMQQTISGMISRPGGRLEEMATMVWEHMGRVGVIARTIAPAFDADADEAFSAGLLHDSGKLVLFDAASRLRVEQRRALRLSADDTRVLLRTLHQPLGALLVDAWGLPTHVVDAIATHHSPGPSSPLAETLFVAERLDLARVAGAPPSVDAWWAEGGLSGDKTQVLRLLDHLPMAA